MLTLLIASVLSPADQVLDRFSQFMRAATVIAVDVEASRSGLPAPGNGTVTLDRNGRLHFAMRWGPFNYVWSQQQQDSIEIEHSERIYHEMIQIPRLVVPSSKLSNVPEWGFPLPIFLGSLKTPHPPETQYRLGQPEQVDGVRTDVVDITFKVPMAQGRAKANIDSEGRLLRYTFRFDLPDGVTEGAFNFKNYRRDPQLPANFFALLPPRGYLPRTLPPDPFPIQPEQLVPALSLPEAGGQPSPLQEVLKGGQTLLLVGREQCEPTRRMAAFLQGLELPSGVRIMSVMEGATGAGGVGRTFVDRDGAALRAFSVQGTPTLFYVDKNATVQKLWFAFDPNRADRFQKEILDTLAGRETE
jgi:hypothetical protein